MCIICTLWEQEKLTVYETNKAMMERALAEDLDDEARDHILNVLLPKILRDADYDFNRLYEAEGDEV